MLVKYHPGDSFNSSPVQPPNLFGLPHAEERDKIVAYLREIADKIEDGDMLAFTKREGSEIVGFEVL